MDNESSKREFLNKHRKLLLVGGPLLFLIVAATIYLLTGRYVSTDDAYVQDARTEISSNVPGRVIEIAVRDNQMVSKDDILFKLDDRDFVNAVESARARLANAKLQITSLKATYRQREADMLATNATLAYLSKEFKRQQELAVSGISSIAQLDQARQSFISYEQQLNASKQDLDSVSASLDGNPDITPEEHPLVQQAQAEFDQAMLNLSYTVIQAPIDGTVAKVEQLQVGDYIKAAAPVFGLVSNADVWVEANFKETELTYMQPGQDATITVDIYPGRKFHGKVVSLSPGTGSSFSLLPPENATGNWVKVVQRLAVRISIEDRDPKKVLAMGLSAIVTVDTKHSRLGGNK